MKIEDVKGSELMEAVDKAIEAVRLDPFDDIANKILLYEAYGFLESENFHSGVSAIEYFTKMEYIELEKELEGWGIEV